MLLNTTRLIQTYSALLLLFLPSGCKKPDEGRLADGEQMTSEGVVIVASGFDAHLSDYDPDFLEAYNAAGE